MKILFAGWHNPFFLSITEYIERALEKLGHEVEKFEYRQFSLPGIIRDSFGLLEKYDINRINQALLKRAAIFKPALVFILQGTTIRTQTILEIRKKYNIPTANWFIDYPPELDTAFLLAKYYDFFFVSNTYAMHKHHQQGNKDVWTLNFACDSDIHKRIELSDDERHKFGNDVVFVGSRHLEREAILEQLTEFDLGLWGPGWKDISKNSPLRRFYRGGSVDPKIWVKIYNASRIVLNINYGFTRLPEEDCSAGSTKLFEILACGGFQIVDNKKAITDIFQDKRHLVTFTDIADLKNKIKHYLDNPIERQAISEEGRKEVLTKHTYEHRMRQMLSCIKL